MICFIYRSKKKSETYLFVSERDNFSDVPEALMKQFGTPEFSMVLQLDKHESLARVDINKVKESLTVCGYFLQLPPVGGDKSVII